MPATFHLCANHHAGNRAGQKLLAELAADLAPGFRACHIGVFHEDDRSFSKATKDFLKSLGASVSSPELSRERVDVEEARAAIEGAELLYLDGGDTVAGVERIRELGLVEVFRRAARSARHVFGLSGGACAAGPYTIGYDEKDAPYVAECLDLGPPLPLDVHDEKAGWPEMRALLALKPKKQKGIVIPSHGVLVVSPEGELASYGKPACERRSLGRDGAFQVEPL